MGKYRDGDFKREEDYQRWLYYRESSHEERAFQREQDCSKSASEHESNDLPAGSIFRNYPGHQAMIAAAEQKYLEEQQKPSDPED